MKMWQIIIVILILGLGNQLLASPAFIRELEPVVVKGNILADFLGVPIPEIQAYIFQSNQNSWLQIPLQIDELDANGYYLALNNLPLKSQLGEYDELVVMSRDLGARAPTSRWIANANSKNFPRYEIEVNDPLNPGQPGYFYLFHATNLPDTLTRDYVDQSLHVIYSAYYTLGHDTSRGYINHLNYPDKKGKWGLNVLDRQKLRLNGTIKVLGFPINYQTTEEKFLVKEVHYIDGRVRVIRQMKWLMTVGSGGINTNVHITTLTSKFYQACTDVASSNTDLKPDYGLQLLRHSVDFNPAAGQFYFSNAYNTNILLNGTPDPGVNKTQDIPGTFWALISGAPGSMLQIINLPNKLGTIQRLYYCEQANGTDDGTLETGNNGAWGDIGLLFTDNVVGQFQFVPRFLLVPYPVDKNWAETEISRFHQPLTLQSQRQELSSGQMTLTLEAPNGGEVWQIGSQQNITWKSTGLTGNVTLSFSADNGKSWQKIATVAATSHQYLWTVPDLESMQSFVKIVSVENSALIDQSDASFVILSANHRLSAGNSETELSGGSHRIDIYLTNHLPVAGIQFNLHDVPNQLDYQSCELTSRLAGFTASVTEHDSCLTVLLYNLSSTPVAAGYGAILGIYYQFKANVDVDTLIHLKLKKAIVSDPEIKALPIETRDGKMRVIHPSDVPIDTEGRGLPATNSLFPNYPNPFNNQTWIPYQLAQNGWVQLRILNVLGQEIRSLVHQYQAAGHHLTHWDGCDQHGQVVGNGIYMLQLQTNHGTAIMKLMLQK